MRRHFTTLRFTTVSQAVPQSTRLFQLIPGWAYRISGYKMRIEWNSESYVNTNSEYAVWQALSVVRDLEVGIDTSWIYTDLDRIAILENKAAVFDSISGDWDPSQGLLRAVDSGWVSTDLLIPELYQITFAMDKDVVDDFRINFKFTCDYERERVNIDDQMALLYEYSQDLRDRRDAPRILLSSEVF